MYSGKQHQAESALYLGSAWKRSLKLIFSSVLGVDPLKDIQSQTKESHPVSIKPPALDCAQVWTCFQVEPKFIRTSPAATRCLSWPMSERKVSWTALRKS